MFPWNFFSANRKNQDFFDKLDEDSFQEMLEKWMKQAFPSFLDANTNKQSETTSHKSLNETVFETHDYIYIRIPISEDEIIDKIKIYYSLNKCMITGVFDNEQPYTIILPSTVKKKGATAIYRDHVLEIKIPKYSDWQFSEIDVDTENQD